MSTAKASCCGSPSPPRPACATNELTQPCGSGPPALEAASRASTSTTCGRARGCSLQPVLNEIAWLEVRCEVRVHSPLTCTASPILACQKVADNERASRAEGSEQPARPPLCWVPVAAHRAARAVPVQRCARSGPLQGHDSSLAASSRCLTPGEHGVRRRPQNSPQTATARSISADSRSLAAARRTRTSEATRRMPRACAHALAPQWRTQALGSALLGTLRARGARARGAA